MFKAHILMITSDPHILDRRIFQQAKSLASEEVKVTVAYTSPNLLLPTEQVKNLTYLPKPLFDTNGKVNSFVWTFWQSIRNLGAHHILSIRLYQFLIAVFKDTALSWREALMKFDWPVSDVLVCHDVPLLPTALVIKKNGLTKKVLLDAHEIFDVQYDAIYSKTARRYWSKICREYKPQADAITTVTQDIAEVMQNRFSLSITPEVVQNTYPFRNLASLKPGMLRRLYAIADQRRIILCMGELRPGRNLEELISAMYWLSGEDAALVFLGMGEKRYITALKRMITKLGLSNVYLGKSVSPEKVVDYAFDADVGIISNRGIGPNNTLGGPNRLYEYIQARLPVLSYQHTGVQKVLDATGTGMVVKWRDPQHLAKLISSMLLYKDDKLNQLEKAARMFCWENDYQTYRAVIDNLLSFSGEK